LQERFEELTKAIYFYDFEGGRDDAFYILLSSRHEGTPAFYLIKSTSGRVHPVDGDFCTFGSGSTQLDEVLVPYAETLGSEASLQVERDRMVERGLPPSKGDFAHMSCFLLFQRTYGNAGQRLAEIDVGGFVHFILQDADGERRQSPRLYVLGKTEENGDISLLRERLAFDCDDELGEIIVVSQVHALLEPNWFILVHKTTGGPITIADFQARFAPVRDRHKTEPLYHVMVAGAVDFEKRKPPAHNYKVFLDIWSGTPAVALDDDMKVDFFEFLRTHT
jgi:hypothetical protein